MQELEKIMKEIAKKSFSVEMREYEADTEVLLDDVEYILEKHMNGTNYPYITSENIESIPPASKAFLQDCKTVRDKYKRDKNGWIPVDKMLPETNDDGMSEDVLVCFAESNCIMIAFYNSDERRWNIHGRVRILEE